MLLPVQRGCGTILCCAPAKIREIQLEVAEEKTKIIRFGRMQRKIWRNEGKANRKHSTSLGSPITAEKAERVTSESSVKQAARNLDRRSKCSKHGLDKTDT